MDTSGWAYEIVFIGIYNLAVDKHPYFIAKVEIHCSTLGLI
jgi:hypothetical protein